MKPSRCAVCGSPWCMTLRSGRLTLVELPMWRDVVHNSEQEARTGVESFDLTVLRAAMVVSIPVPPMLIVWWYRLRALVLVGRRAA